MTVRVVRRTQQVPAVAPSLPTARGGSGASRSRHGSEAVPVGAR